MQIVVGVHSGLVSSGPTGRLGPDESANPALEASNIVTKRTNNKFAVIDRNKIILTIKAPYFYFNLVGALYCQGSISIAKSFAGQFQLKCIV